MAANTVELSVGKNAQEAGLQFGRHVADFVEKQRATIRLLETTAPLCLRPGKSAAFMAEKLGFQQILGNGGGIDGDKRLVGARAVAMQRTRNQFLAGARFTVDQHGDMRNARAGQWREKPPAWPVPGREFPARFRALR